VPDKVLLRNVSTDVLGTPSISTELFHPMKHLELLSTFAQKRRRATHLVSHYAGADVETNLRCMGPACGRSGRLFRMIPHSYWHKKFSVYWISSPRNGREQNFNRLSKFRKMILMAVWPKNFNHVSVDMPRSEDMRERVGSFVRQIGACRCRQDFGAVIISCNLIYWHLPFTEKMNLRYPLWKYRFRIKGEREVLLHLRCSGIG
jgi:hypothetical protein